MGPIILHVQQTAGSRFEDDNMMRKIHRKKGFNEKRENERASAEVEGHDAHTLFSLL